MNSQTNLTVGDVTADEVEVEIRTPAVSITAGEKLTYYQIEDGVENLIGVFYAEAPTVATKTSIRFKAYDGKAKLTTDFSEWLNANQDKFPMSLRTLVGYSCEVAGVPLAADSFQFDSLSIPAFYAQGVTCRQIVSWAAQISGCFVSCNTAGEIFFDWYRETSVWVSAKRTSVSSDYSFSIENGCLILSYHGVMPQYSIDESGCLILECSGEEPSVHIDENGHLVQPEQVAHQYRLDSLSKKNYSTDTIRRVQFKQETNDVGVIYPADADGNVFSISRNGIAAVLDSDTLRTIAQSLYEKLKSVSYVPLSFKLSRTASIRAGDIVSVTDGNGNTVSTYVMKVYLDSSGTQISSTGDQNYSDKAAVSSEQYRNIPGKVLLLEKSVDGLRIENKDTAGKVAKLELTVDGLKTSVEDAEGDISKLEQSSKEITASVESVKKTSEDALKEAQKNATDLSNYANQVNGSLTDLQNQIDGAIETWFFSYEPKTTNAPASSWTTTEDKNKHLGDLFYIIDNKDKGGLVYRWALTNGVYGWVLVEDTEVAKALETASQAKDTADGKRRVFVTQPNPPYDVGDLWTNNTDLYVCQTARATGNYTASDWKLATEYTTESRVKTLVEISEKGMMVEVSSAKEQADKALEAANGIEVGGRNLLFNSKGDFVTDPDDLNYGYLDLAKETYYHGIKLDAGQPYILSYDWSVDWKTTTPVLAQVLASIGVGETPGQYTKDIHYAWNPFGETGNSGRAVVSFTPPGNVLGERPYFAFRLIRTDTSDLLGDSVWTIRNIQLEKGNRPTDWTPAPEDVDGEISEVKEEVSTLKVTSKGVDMVSEDSNGRLVSFIGNRDTGGVWEAKYTKNGAVTSALYFDFAANEFVFTGAIKGGSININDRFKVDSNGNVTLPSGTSITWGMLPSSVASTGEIPTSVSELTNDSGYQTSTQVESTITGKGYQTASQVTTITENTIATTNVVAQYLHVNAANIDGILEFGDGAYYIAPNRTDGIYLSLPGLEVDSDGATFDGAIYASSGKIGEWSIDESLKYITTDAHGRSHVTKIGVSGATFNAGYGSSHIGVSGASFTETSAVSGGNYARRDVGLNYSGLLFDFASYAAAQTFDSHFNVGFSSGAYIQYTAVFGSGNKWVSSRAELVGTWLGTSSQAITSDAGKKHDILDLDERYMTLFDLIRPVAYKYNDGTSGRYHTGFIANEVEEALEKAGIDTQEFAGFVTIDEKNEDGTIAKTRCLRYEEFIAILWSKVKQLEKRLEYAAH